MKLEIDRVDEDLFTRRKITVKMPDTKAGFGYDVMLACGHKCWIAVEPPETLYCTFCIERALGQLYGMQKEHGPVAAHDE